MELQWEDVKSIKGCTLSGIYANQLNIHQFNKELILHPTTPILAIEYPKTHEVKYWSLEWMEDKAGDDLLLVKEKETPKPLEYMEGSHCQRHIIKSSSFFIQPNVINQVIGYGVKNGESPVLTSIILKLEEVYIFIKAGPVIEIRITENKPIGLGDLIFFT
jgi:hypothetical protein